MFASVDYTLTANVEALVLQGAGNLSGTGNALANSIFGNAGDNMLDGGAGVDVLHGQCRQRHLRLPHRRRRTATRSWTLPATAQQQEIRCSSSATAPGATFTNIDATHWQVNFNGGASHEIITFMNGASIDPTDYAFI